MAVTPRVLIEPKSAEDADTTQYTAANCTTIIDKFTATNVSGANQTLDVHLVPQGGAADSTNLIAKAVQLAAGRAYAFPEVVGQMLAPGGFISTKASATSSVVISSAGREVTG